MNADTHRSSTSVRPHAGCAAATAWLALSFTAVAVAQGKLEDYERAERFVAGNLEKLTSRLTLTPHWLGKDSDRFWYVEEGDRHSAEGSKRFVLVDGRTGTVSAAFDHRRLAAALCKQSVKECAAEQLPFDELDELMPGRTVSVTIEANAWRCDLRAYECARAPSFAAMREGEAISPDRRWAVYRDGQNLLARDRRDGTVRTLTTDGAADNGYAGMSGFATVADKLRQEKPVPVVVFSADSTKVLTYQLDTRAVRKVQVLQTVSGSTPVAHSYSHPLPGDPSIAQARLMTFDLASGERLDVGDRPLSVAATYESLIDTQLRWSADGSRLYYVGSSRGYKTTTLYVADARSGKTATVAEDQSDTYVAPTPIVLPVGRGESVVWSSERDGWNHLYLADGSGAGVQRQLTSGEWVVFDALHVDAGWVYFTAGGREHGRDPYFRHLYRVRLDGGTPQLLTPEDADHTVSIAPNGKFFVDTYSRMDLPPVSVLRRADGKQIRVLQQADISRLQAAGWSAPERFTVKSGDGVTDLYGLMFRPSNFDPTRKYAVIDSLYPGPQIIATPKSFHPGGRRRSQELPLAELGFVVVIIDAKGTPLRSRAFREVQYGKLGYGGGLEDHVVAIKALAARYPSLDIERVGVFGHSGGGYAAARALLMFPDFYKVGVASNGNHDTRAYWAAWGERYQGYPVDDNYDAQSNASLAARLEGKLLLAHGNLDDNVHPHHTLALADALIRANKDFDLLILPNRDHAMTDLGRGKDVPSGLDPYFVRRRWDYFVRYLLGIDPPRGYAIKVPAG